MIRLLIPLLTAGLVLLGSARAGDPVAPVRIGVLAFGTVNWEIAAMENEGLAKASGIRVIPTNLASAEAAKIALQGKAVDVIVADWIWVARQREQGADFAFAPYSTSHGALMVPADSAIHSVGDLKGKKLGIAGGGLDKNWLLLQGLAKKKYGFDLDKSVEKVFGAPPLLNQQFLQGKLDALLNYWHYAAKLEAQGYRSVLDGRALLRELGIDAELANLGYVFRESWASDNSAALKTFIEVSEKARGSLCESDAAWQKVVPLTQESDPKTSSLLRQRYCEGQIKTWGEREVKAAGQVFDLLHEVGGEALTGKSEHLPAGVFWPFRK